MYVYIYVCMYVYIYIWTRYVQCIKPPGLGLGLGLCLRLILLSRLTSLGRGFLRVVIGGRRHIGLLCLLAARVPESGSTTEITHTHTRPQTALALISGWHSPAI